MIERIKYFWEKLALIVLVLVFILFEIRLVVVMHELFLEILFGLVNLWLLLLLLNNAKRYYTVRWQGK